MSIVVAILILSFLILVHEVGHFAAAKLLGVRVIEFSMFMGPRLLSFKKGETRYSLKLIPIGGSCLMEGEESSSDDDRALNRKPKWARAVIFAAGPFMNISTAFILVLILNMYVGYNTNIIEHISEYSPAATASTPMLVGDEIVAYAGKRVHVPIEVFIYQQDTKGAPAEITFKRGGDTMKTTITPDIMPGKRYVLGFNGVQSYGPDWNLIDLVQAGTPADMLGLQPGDRILTVDGKAPGSRADLRAILAGAGGGEVDVTWVKQDGAPASGRVTPNYIDEEDGYYTGINEYEAIAAPSIIGAVQYAYYISASYSKMVLYSLKWMVTGAIGLNQMSGPVGIVAEIGEGVEATSKSPLGIYVMVSYILNLSALIGINLGLFNLIPFPPLDGSKLLLLGVEAIRRKDIPPERQLVISMIGFVFLILVLVFTLFNDISRIIAK